MIKIGDCVSYVRAGNWKCNIVVRAIVGDFLRGDYYWTDATPRANDILGTITTVPVSDCTLLRSV